MDRGAFKKPGVQEGQHRMSNKRYLEERIVFCANCDANRRLQYCPEGLVCVTCASRNWMYLPSSIPSRLQAGARAVGEAFARGAAKLSNSALQVLSQSSLPVLSNTAMKVLSSNAMKVLSKSNLPVIPGGGPGTQG